MNRVRGNWTLTAFGVALLTPLLVLFVMAAADEWRAPALVPQRWGTRGLRAALDDPVLPDAVLNSVAVAVGVALVALPLAWPAARSLRTLGPSARTIVAVLLLGPLLLPPLAIGEGLRSTFLSLGMGPSLWTIGLSHLVFVVPYETLVLVPSMTDRLADLEEAATGLGASGRHRFRWITLPALIPNALLAVALGAIVSWAQYGTTLGVGAGIPTLPLVLVPFVRRDAQVASVLAVIQLLPALALVWAAVSRRRSPNPG